jgi:hypothetical protein
VVVVVVQTLPMQPDLLPTAAGREQLPALPPLALRTAVAVAVEALTAALAALAAQVSLSSATKSRKPNTIRRSNESHV